MSAPAFTWLCFLWLIPTLASAQQDPYIDGPFDICLGDCATFTIEGLEPGISADNYVWTFVYQDGNDGFYVETQEPFLTYCDFAWDGLYYLSVQFETDNGQTYLAEFTFFVFFNYIFAGDIYSTASDICPAGNPQGGGASSCEKVCVGSTVLYFAEIQANDPGNLDLYWDISGTGDGQIGNQGFDQVEITWETPGIAFVNVIVNTLCYSEIISLCVEVLPEPEATFTAVPEPENGVVSICQGESVAFTNTSTGADTYLWDFGDGSSSDEVDPIHTYFDAGTFQATLVALNECFCADTTFLTIEVDALETPLLDCISAVCPGEIITYTSDAVCGSYAWTVSDNGTIIEGGGPDDAFITIEWSDGEAGYIELDVEDCPALDQCLGVAQVQVPIISDLAQIEGPDRVCKGENANYSTLLFEGTSYEWEVSAFGTILSGQGTNSIDVQWFDGFIPTEDQWVAVSFENCYLGCGGMDTLPVFIRPEFYVEGPIEVCNNEDAVFSSINVQSNQPFNSNWAILDLSGTMVWSTVSPEASPTISWNYPPGIYTLRTTPEIPGDFCEEEFISRINVVAPPPPVDSIAGESTICPGLIYNYEAVSANPQNQFRWIINDGGTTQERVGNPINVLWGATPPYELTVTEVSSFGLACESAPNTFTIQPITNVTVSGDDLLCREESGIYQTTPYTGVDFLWTIIPSTAGTIITNPDSSAVIINWHTAGIHTVGLEICGLTSSINVEVQELPDPLPVHPGEICPGETAMAYTTLDYSAYQWLDENGSLVTTADTAELSPGYYELIVEDEEGCMDNSTFQIAGFPASEVTISTPDFTRYCGVSNPNVFFYATDSDTGYDFQWMYNGGPVGNNSPEYLGMGYGSYWVEIIDENNCRAVSNVITVVEDCGGGGGPIDGPACFGNNINFAVVPTANCNEHNYLNQTSGYVPGTLVWNFDDPDSGANNTSTEENPSHVFTRAGYYKIFLFAQFEDPNNPGIFLTCVDFMVDQVPLAANFSWDNACPGAPLQFNDLSTFLPPSSIFGWEWDFGDPASGADNTSSLKNPAHTYAVAGSYDVTLTVTSSDGCVAVLSQEVNVFPEPDVSFAAPTINCENTALPFIAEVSDNVTDVVWDFGDPGSGDANSSEKQLAYHIYGSPGIYTVSLTATSIYGCISSFSLNVEVEPNNLGGDILLSQASPICEGDSIILTAPVGGSQWQWSTGSTDSTIVVYSSGVYEVTVSNDRGCTYQPPVAAIDVLAEPEVNIRSVLYNQFGQATDYFYDSFETCEGEGVFLEAVGSTGYTFDWSLPNETTSELEFSEDRGNLLDAGVYEIFVTATDPAGCSVTEGPFELTIHPTPTNVIIQSSPDGVVCANTETTFTVQNPDPNLTYIWNTGTIGTSLTTSAGGIYYVRAVTDFGCEAESNRLTILDGPNFNLVPAGCHTRCSPDTLCLPAIPGAVSYQWYFNGSPIPGPEGTIPELVVENDGDYYLEITDNLGCVQNSVTLSLELYEGFGSFGGNVYVDVNENGLIDAADTLISGIDIQLLQNGITLDTATSNADGAYNFPNFLSSAYTLELDTLGLPFDLIATQVQVDTQLVGCDDEVLVDWLLTPFCEPVFANIDLQFCQGDTLFYAGTGYTTDTTFMLSYINSLGCDSTEIVNLETNSTSTGTALLMTCPGTTVEYEGVELTIGEVVDFILSGDNECDSTVTVTVAELLPSASPLSLSACTGSTVMYEGVELAIGEVQDFVFTNAVGCDSVVTVTVEELLPSSFGLDLEACTATTVNYNGEELSPGTVQDFVFTNAVGCDSVVTVTVAELALSASSVALTACTGTTASYQGVDFPVGTEEDFIYTNAAGCDSVVTVTVSELLPSASSLELTACTGTTAAYQGVDLPIGTQQDFTFINAVGCDSVVTVTVGELPASASSLTLNACSGTTVDYLGLSLSPGTVTDFTLTNALGCDSVVTVTVMESFPSALTLELGACPGEMVEYNNVSLGVGEVMDFVFTNNAGCDSVVTVSIMEFPTQAVDLNVAICEGDVFEFNGFILETGTQTDVTFANQYGCDSMVTVAVSSYPAMSFSVFGTESCPDATTGMISIENMAGGTPPFSYTLDGVNYQSEAIFTDLGAGTYLVEARDANGCMLEEEVMVEALPELTFEVSNTVIDCELLETSLQVQVLSGNDGNLLYSWQDGTIGPSLTVSDPGTYILQVENDCQVISREVEVDFEQENRQSYFYIPNAFSPNNDGINDEFQCFSRGSDQATDFELLIFDRWGNQMYQSDDVKAGWDGRFRGKRLDSGVYVWHIRAKVWSCGREIEIREKGDVALVR